MKRKKYSTWELTFTAEEAGSLWHVVLWYLSIGYTSETAASTPLEATDPCRLIGSPAVSVPAEVNSMFRLTGAPDLSTPAKAKSSRRGTGASELAEVRSPCKSTGFLMTSFRDSGSPCGLIGAPASIPEEASSRCKLIAGPPSASTPAEVGGEAGGLLVAGARRKSSGQRSLGTVVRSSSMGSASSRGPCRI